MKLWYTRKEAAEALGYSDPNRVTILIKSGQLPEFNPTPKARKRISVKAVEEFIRKHTKNAHLLT